MVQNLKNRIFDSARAIPPYIKTLEYACVSGGTLIARAL